MSGRKTAGTRRMKRSTELMLDEVSLLIQIINSVVRKTKSFQIADQLQYRGRQTSLFDKLALALCPFSHFRRWKGDTGSPYLVAIGSSFAFTCCMYMSGTLSVKDGKPITCCLSEPNRGESSIDPEFNTPSLWHRDMILRFRRLGSRLILLHLITVGGFTHWCSNSFIRSRIPPPSSTSRVSTVGVHPHLLPIWKERNGLHRGDILLSWGELTTNWRIRMASTQSCLPHNSAHSIAVNPLELSLKSRLALW